MPRGAPEDVKTIVACDVAVPRCGGQIKMQYIEKNRFFHGTIFEVINFSEDRQEYLAALQKPS
jgi:hypothetical protein